jgi:hypothetical protein
MRIKKKPKPITSAKKPKTPRRRIMYSAALGATICEHIASGRCLKEVCELNGMPGRTTAYKWLEQHGDFADMYARAREKRAEMIADEVITIADTDPDPVRARVRIDARKWWAAKVNPKAYGDKAEVNVTGNHTVTHSPESVSATEKWLMEVLGEENLAPPPLSAWGRPALPNGRADNPDN